MRKLLIALALTLPMAMPAKAAAWVAYCYGKDAQYSQEIGGVGYLHVGRGDDTYETLRLNQSFYDGKVLCGTADPKAPQVSEQIAQVCVDKPNKSISVLYLGQPAHGNPPRELSPYCDAKVTAH